MTVTSARSTSIVIDLSRPVAMRHSPAALPVRQRHVDQTRLAGRQMRLLHPPSHAGLLDAEERDAVPLLEAKLAIELERGIVRANAYADVAQAQLPLSPADQRPHRSRHESRRRLLAAHDRIYFTGARVPVDERQPHVADGSSLLRSIDHEENPGVVGTDHLRQPAGRAFVV